MAITDFLVARDDISNASVSERDFPTLEDGQVLLEVERFGLSANNITYAVLGDAMGYWNFFPAEDGKGSVPVWGYASVVESKTPGIEEGARFFGYLPLSTHVIVQPRVSAAGFTDVASHRTELPAVYQRYMSVASESIPGSPEEDQQSLWRPLFTTSYGVADFIEENDGFGATTAVLTSASSKTALASAFCLKQSTSALELVGLTSSGNVAFCESTGYYDRVVSYDEIPKIGDEQVVVIDFAGNSDTLNAITEFAGEKLVRTVVVGLTHWEDRGESMMELAPGRELFFLPTWIEKRSAEWGPTEFFERSEKAWEAFLPTVGEWLKLEEHTGTEAIAAVYQSVLAGESRPDIGHILTFA